MMDGIQSFTVYDLCLAVTSHPVASVSVSGVGSVQVKVIDKVEVGKEVRAQVQVSVVYLLVTFVIGRC